ncbi:hypothetical protein OAQ99_03400 [Candidatus Kapabacteria bacterium]|nr:hypothetical protein [Candidatus Kapabacteria bacterium]
MKQMIVTNYKNMLVAIFFIAAIISCGDNKFKEKEVNDVETINSGKFSYVCDQSISKLISPAVEMYLEKYTKVELTDTITSARSAMSMLFAAKHRVAIIARDYLPDELQLMEANGMEPHQRLKAAEDALVFAVNKEFPIKFTKDSIIKSIFLDGNSFKNFYEEIDYDIDYFIKDRNSSENSNFEKLILNYKPLKKNLKIEKSTSEILKKVSESVSNIGLVYMSQVLQADTSLGIKMLPLGFVDSTGKYQRAVPVHQSYLVRGRYPYTFVWFMYMLEERQNLPYWFSKYIAQETKVQKYFLDQGVVPAFAKFRLIPEN